MKEQIGKWIKVIYKEGNDETRVCQGILAEDELFLILKGDTKTFYVNKKNVVSIHVLENGRKPRKS